jgi:hypothetical protein
MYLVQGSSQKSGLMKNALNLFLLILSLHPALLSAQTIQEAGWSQTVTDPTLAFSVKIPFKKAILLPRRNEKNIVPTLYSSRKTA